MAVKPLSAPVTEPVKEEVARVRLNSGEQAPKEQRKGNFTKCLVTNKDDSINYFGNYRITKFSWKIYIQIPNLTFKLFEYIFKVQDSTMITTSSAPLGLFE